MAGRWRTLVGAVALGGLGVGALPADSPPARAAAARDPNPCVGPSAAKLRCPRLSISRPSDMHFDRRPSGRLVLRARSSLNSIGRGPIELRGKRRGPNSMTAKQRIYRRGGGHVEVRTGAHLGFKSIPGQYRYWKLLNAARFELWSVDSGGRPVKRVRRGPKLYYCLRDLKRTRPSRRSPRHRVYPACSQRKSAKRVRLGTSVGWSDIYPATYHEQWIDVTGLHGRFLYVLIADPAGVIYTSNRRPPRASRIVRIP